MDSILFYKIRQDLQDYLEFFYIPGFIPSASLRLAGGGNREKILFILSEKKDLKRIDSL